ncbi:MAG: hypothetical protein ACLR8L_00050 [Oscillospiraceae bacterium]
MRNSIGRIEDAINGAPGGYVWNKYAYEQKETSAATPLEKATSATAARIVFVYGGKQRGDESDDG